MRTTSVTLKKKLVLLEGSPVKLIGRGFRTNQVHQPVLDVTQLAQLKLYPASAAEKRWGTACSRGRRG